MSSTSFFLPVVEIAAYIIGLIGIIGGVFSFLRYGNYQTTVKLQNDSIKALEDNNKITKQNLDKSIKEVKELRVDSAKQIGILEGQVQLYKDLNLEKIAIALVAISESNTQILNTLKQSATTLAINTTEVATTADNVKTALAKSK